MKALLILFISLFMISCSHYGHHGSHGDHHGKSCKFEKNKWAEIDVDKDGKVSKEEFIKAKGDHFAKMDTNNDGFITDDEKNAHHKERCEGKN